MKVDMPSATGWEYQVEGSGGWTPDPGLSLTEWEPESDCTEVELVGPDTSELRPLLGVYRPLGNRFSAGRRVFRKTGTLLTKAKAGNCWI